MTKRINLYRTIIILIIGLGCMLRLFLYLQNRSFIFDETALALNVIQKHYTDLTGSLLYVQAAPPFFLLISKVISSIFASCNVYFQDLALRFLPLLMGILSIFVFYKYLKAIFKAKKEPIIISLFLLSFNITAIEYCARFKQYTLELFISIILMHIFYNIIFKKKQFFYYLPLILIAPWFSLSSGIIILSNIIILTFLKRKIIKPLLTFLFFDGILYYFLYLKSNLAYNRPGMENFWSHFYGFFSFAHPTRLLIRIGEFFTLNKIGALLIGLIILALFIRYFLSKENIVYKTYYTLPFIITILLSSMHLYLIIPRLMLFLFPLITIIISKFSGEIAILLKICLCIFSISFSTCYVANIPELTLNSRETILNTIQNLDKNDIIIIDDIPTWKYYSLSYNLKNKIIELPYLCKDNLERCFNDISKFSNTNYHLLVDIKVNDLKQ